jgi:hypothetical protein
MIIMQFTRLQAGLCLLGISALAQSPPTVPLPLGPTPSDGAGKVLRDARSTAFNMHTTGQPIDSNDPRSAPVNRIILTLPVRPELPSTISDAIIVGTISSIYPYFSQNHGCIYSEFTVHVERTIDQLPSIATKSEIAIDEIGGAVMSSSGRVLRTDVIGMGAPLANGGRYLFFLRYLPKQDAYDILKAWDLTIGTAKAMAADDLLRARNNSSAFDGMNVQAFLSVASVLKAGGSHH